jgi:spermidine/putrescine transport system substrate-binding protein
MNIKDYFLKGYLYFVGLFLALFILVVGLYVLYTNESQKFKKRELCLLAWSRNFDMELLNDFEKKTGIKVHLAKYGTNEELISKMRLSGGKGIDLIVPSDYAVNILYDLNLIKKIDKSRIPFLPKLYPGLVHGAEFKDEDLYGIPMEWGIYGLLFDKRLLDKYTVEQLEHIIIGLMKNPGILVGIPNDYVAVITFVYNYLVSQHEDIKKLSSVQLYNMLYDAMKKQKENIHLYSDTRIADAFSRGEVEVCFIQHGEYIQASMPTKYFIPISSGALISIEYFAIPNAAEHIDEAYEFLNYYFDKKIMAKNAEISLSFPSLKEALDEMDLDDCMKNIVRLIEYKKIPYYPSQNVLPEKDMISLWLSIKAL